MEYLGQHSGRSVYWLKISDFNTESLPKSDWIWFCISNTNININQFEPLQRIAIQNDLLEFKSSGKFGEKLHDYFDEIVVNMEVLENNPEISIMTTGDNDTSLAESFWECFYVTCLPETANLDNVKIVCTSLEGIDLKEELTNYLENINNGWLPD